jgi:hypothetical protein
MKSFKQFFKEALQMIGGKMSYRPEGGTPKEKESFGVTGIAYNKFWIKQDGSFVSVPSGMHHIDVIADGESKG